MKILKWNQVILSILLLTFLSGCAKTNINNSALLTDAEYSQPLKLVNDYNSFIFVRDWNKARDCLAGQALKAFDSNINKYNNSANLIGQNNELETEGEKFCIIKSRVYIEVMGKDSERYLYKKILRYYLNKEKDWKIIKVNEIENQYPNKLNSSIKDKQLEQKIKQIVDDYIKYSAEGNIRGASKYLTGNLIDDAEKYKISNIPKLEAQQINLEVLGAYEDGVFIQAKYFIDNRQIKMIFHLIKIDNVWLINEQILD